MIKFQYSENLIKTIANKKSPHTCGVMVAAKYFGENCVLRLRMFELRALLITIKTNKWKKINFAVRLYIKKNIWETNHRKAPTIIESDVYWTHIVCVNVATPLQYYAVNINIQIPIIVVNVFIRHECVPIWNDSVEWIWEGRECDSHVIYTEKNTLPTYW